MSRRSRSRWRRNRNVTVVAAITAWVMLGGDLWWIPLALLGVYVAARSAAWWIRQRRQVTAGEPRRPIAPIGRARRCAVYRFYGPPGMRYNPWVRRLVPSQGEGRQLLYIGKAVNPRRRRDQHAADKPWWPFVDESATVIEWLPSEAEAFDVEEEAIKSEMPLFNDVHNKENPTRVEQISGWPVW